jgi:hypothetical protein
MDSTSSFRYQLSLNAIFDALKLASKHRGKVFGGFVRDVIVPINYGRRDNLSFKDVDLWFRDEKDANSFITEMGNKFQKQILVGEGQKDSYEFYRTQYHLICYGFTLAFFDIIVSVDIPVNDFDVNMLTYQITEDGTFKPKAYGEHSTDLLIAKIKSRTAGVLSSYNKSPLMKTMRITRTNQRYIKRGWSVMYKGQHIKDALELESIFILENERVQNVEPDIRHDKFMPFN